MQTMLSVLGVVAGLLFMAVSGWMNARFMVGQGLTLWDAVPLGVASVALTLACGLLPFFISRAWQSRKIFAAVVGGLLLVLCMTMSVLSAIGFAAQNRGAMVGGREAVTTDYDVAKAKRDDVRQQLSQVSRARPALVVESDIARLHQDRLWTSTRECSEATAMGSRVFCQRLAELGGELAAARKSGELRADLDRLEQDLRRLRAAGAGHESDPQASLVSRLLGVPMAQVRSGWEVMLAVLLELGAAFLPFLATAGLPKFPTHSSPAAPVIEAEVIELKPVVEEQEGAAEPIPRNRWIETAQRNGMLKTKEKKR